MQVNRFQGIGTRKVQDVSIVGANLDVHADIQESRHQSKSSERSSPLQTVSCRAQRILGYVRSFCCTVSRAIAIRYGRNEWVTFRFYLFRAADEFESFI